MLISPLSVERLNESIKRNSSSYCSKLFHSARWFVFSRIAEKGTHIIVLPDEESAEYCASDLYNLIEGDRVFFFPDSGIKSEKSNYKYSLGVQRTAAIKKLTEGDGEDLLVIVTYPSALEEGIPKKDKIRKNTFRISVGEGISHESIKEKLKGLGFEKVDFVSAPGQYAIRGAILDIFSYSDNNPYRVYFFGNEVEKISVFDCNTQLSNEKKESVEIVMNLIAEEDESENESLIKIVPANTIVWLDSSDMYKGKEFYGELLNFKRVYIDTPISYSGVKEPISFNISPQPVFNKNFGLLTADIGNRMENGYKVCIYGEKQSQLDRLKSILIENKGLIPEFIQGKNIHKGFIDNEGKICCYSDHEIFDRYHRVVIRRTVEKSEQLTLNDLSAFNIGDYIVHIDYGVGIFGGLVKMRDEKGRVNEAVKLMYKDGDVVFVSVHSIYKISRYRSKDSTPPKICHIGSGYWQSLRNRTKNKVKDIAKELIQLYAKRKASAGFSFSSDTYLQEELESSFMYEDTPDQIDATRDVKRDMEDKSPMDRLICGDVGFGKTEIAIRAAFKAVSDNKQVAVLVPTTILSLQHYNTFKSRLENFPVKIDYVSRLRTGKETNTIKRDLEKGRIDIIIGTHKILSKNFVFKDLGLLIIDEEQKFGVSAKERLRELKTSVDTLTLTATPIPRTLQFSLLGARDLSIISTAPPNRIPIQTKIILFDEQEIKRILEYELRREGQIFFLHNKVEDLESIKDILHRLKPDMKICVAHGQMESKELEGRMLDFIQGDYDLLLCTTIIENGLDIPNANTIIINQAQNFGLSDLHQLRGRVGRSNKKAFCYLIVPPMVSLSDDAKRRLKAIEEFSDLGSGFNIAMNDLDIRGAGNLLGAEQSGYIAEMGYESYQKIINEAMDELGIETGFSSKNTKGSYVDDCSIETDQAALIPADYIDIPAEKMRIYKELDSADENEDLDRMYINIEDRFGPMPQELKDLFTIVRIRHLGEKLGFEKIIIKNNIMIMSLIRNQESPYYRSGEFENLLRSVGRCGKGFELINKDDKLRLVSKNVGSIKEAYENIRKLIPLEA